MKMKINWGTKLVMAMAAFMTMLIIFVVLMMREDVNLVESDYYPKGQNYQAIIDKKQHADALNEALIVGYSDGFISMQFPKKLVYNNFSGIVHGYNRMDSKKDFTIILKSDSSSLLHYQIDKLHGRYILKTEWENAGVSYFNENVLNIP